MDAKTLTQASHPPLVASQCEKLTESLTERLIVADLLGRLSHELTSAAAMADDLQQTIGDALGLDVSSDISERLQQLDDLTQRLGDLAGLTERLAASECPGVVPKSVLQGLKLSSLEKRLSGEQNVATHAFELEIW